jgi:Fe-S cluster assembly protein SufD
MQYWARLPVDARRFIVREITRRGNEDPELNFSRLLRRGMRDEDPEVRALVSEWPRGVESPVFDLNTAFMEAGVVIRVKADTALDKPLHLAFVTAGSAEATIYARNVLIVENGASVTFVESYEGPDGVAYHVNAATRFKVGDNARLTYVKAQRDGDAAMHFAAIGGEIGEGANVVLAPITIGAALSRNTVGLRFDGRDTVGNFAGVQMLGGRQHGDTTLFADHKAPACVSRKLFKSVLDERARGVFQGQIVVRQEAQKTDGHQLNRALLLSDEAEIDAKPNLEIYADDVKCSHGATVGQLDESMLFYLRSRGIDADTARSLLIYAFADDVIRRVGIPQVRAHVEDAVLGRLPDSDRIREFV